MLVRCGETGAAYVLLLCSVTKLSDSATPWTAARQASLSITDSMDMSVGELRELVMDREAWRAAVHGVAEPDSLVTEHNSSTYAAPVSPHLTSTYFLFFK